MIKNEGKVQAYQVCGQIRLVDALLTSPLLSGQMPKAHGIRLAKSQMRLVQGGSKSTTVSSMITSSMSISRRASRH